MFKQITTQTKCQGQVINFLNKPYNNYCKKAKKDTKQCLSYFNPLCFLKTSQISFTIFSISKKIKKKQKLFFFNFPNKKHLLGFKINIRRNHGNKVFVLWPNDKTLQILEQEVFGRATNNKMWTEPVLSRFYE